MKLIKQLGIFFTICFLSICVEWILPFPFPATVIGMLLLLTALLLKILKVEQIHDVSNFLLKNLPFFFIPASISIINYVDLLRGNLLAFLIICLVTIVLTFGATVFAVRLTVKLTEGRKK